MKNDYKYNEAMVRFYDAVYDNLPGLNDRDYYINKMKSAKGPVLEIGCGTGRLFTEALKLGADVFGIDQSQLMLEKLKEKIDAKDYYRVHLMDATEIKLDKKFSLIIAPFRMFQHVMSVDEQLKVLRNVKEHLADSGEFIFDVFNPDLNMIQTGREESLQFSGEYAPGKAIRRYHAIKPDLLNQIQHVTFRFEWDEDGEIKQAEYYAPMRYFFRYELEHLVARAGLKLKNVYGDLMEKELNENSHTLLTVCTR